jgi:hypothetical protein
MFVLAEALQMSEEVAHQARDFGEPASHIPAGCARGHERDITGSLAIRPMPLPCSKTPADPAGPRR